MSRADVAAALTMLRRDAAAFFTCTFFFRLLCFYSSLTHESMCLCVCCVRGDDDEAELVLVLKGGEGWTWGRSFSVAIRRRPHPRRGFRREVKTKKKERLRDELFFGPKSCSRPRSRQVRQPMFLSCVFSVLVLVAAEVKILQEPQLAFVLVLLMKGKKERYRIQYKCYISSSSSFSPRRTG